MKQMRAHKFNPISKSVTQAPVPLLRMQPIMQRLGLRRRLLVGRNGMGSRGERLPNKCTPLLCGCGCFDGALGDLVDVFACNALHTQAGSDKLSHA